MLDVPATLAARTRVLGTGRSNKNDPNDAWSVAITALRTRGLRQVQAVGHSEVLRLLAKRNSDIGDHRTRLVCRLHALLLELAAGGIAKEINASDVDRFLAQVTPTTPVEQVRYDLAVELLDDIRRLDAQLKASHKRIRAAVAASGTSLTDLFGIGPIIAAMLIGYTGDIARFANRDHYAAYNGTAPVEFSSGGRTVHRLSQRGNRNPQPRDAHGRDLPAPPPRLRRPRLLRPARRRGQDQEGSAPLPEASRQQRRLPPTRRRRARARADNGPGRTNGNDSKASVTGLTSLTTGSSAKSLPDPRPTLRPRRLAVASPRPNGPQTSP